MIKGGKHIDNSFTFWYKDEWGVEFNENRRKKTKHMVIAQNILQGWCMKKFVVENSSLQKE
jgi:hypothetical protein